MLFLFFLIFSGGFNAEAFVSAGGTGQLTGCWCMVSKEDLLKAGLKDIVALWANIINRFIVVSGK